MKARISPNPDNYYFFRSAATYSSVPKQWSVLQAAPAIETLKRIDSFGNFEEGWDGYEASRIPLEVVERAKAIVKQLGFDVDVAPVPSGAIQLEFERGEDYLEIVVDPNSFTVYEESDEPSDCTRFFDPAMAVRLITNFIWQKESQTMRYSIGPFTLTGG